MQDIKKIKIGCIGCGTMGGSIIKAIANKYNNGSNIFLSAKHFEKAQKAASEINATALQSNLEVASKSEIIFIAVKPAFVKEVLKEIQPSFTEQKIVVSMAAGLNLNTLINSCKESELSASDINIKAPHVIRIMPNLPATVGQAMTALCCNNEVLDDEIKTVSELLCAAGKVEQVTEKLMDGVTAVSGSGPAYAFMFIEALADAAVKFGMPRKQAYIYAAQTLKGAAAMALEDNRSISELKDAVCSPSGTTIEGVISLERHCFRGTIIEAATAAYNKSIDLGRK